MSKESDSFLFPKSIFKGVNADGTKFTVKEWDFNSIANFDMSDYGPLLGAALFAMIASPISLILAILTYDGKIGILNVIGIVIGTYFLFDANHSWLVTTFMNIFLSGNALSFLVAANIAAIICHVVLLFLTIFLNDSLIVFPRMWITLFAMCFLFMISFMIGTSITDAHGTYEPWRISKMQKERDERLGLNQDYGDFKSKEERDAHFKNNQFNR